MKQLSIVDIGIDNQNGHPLLLLEVVGTGLGFPMYIGATEADILVMALNRVEFPRPLPQELLLDAYERFGYALKEFSIDSFESNVFYGVALFENNEQKTIRVDCRVSDGIYMAVIENVPMRCVEKVVERAGVPLDDTATINEEFEGFVENDGFSIKGFLGEN